MGRLAQNFAGLSIVDMIPYNMPTEQSLASATNAPSAFPNSDLQNSTDKPFAVHRLIPEVIALLTTGVPIGTQPDIRVMETLIKLSGQVTGPNQDLFKAPTRLRNLLMGTTSQHAWSFEEPIVFPSASNVGMNLLATCDTFPTAFTDSSITALRVTINLQGYLLVIGPQG